MKGLVLRVVLMLAVSAAVGVGHARYRGLPLLPDLEKLREQEDEHAVWARQTAIDLAAFKQHYEMGWLVLDARAREMFEEGHLNAPLIMNIPADEADYHINRVLPYRGQPIVIYCSSEKCDTARILWNTLMECGFLHDVYVFHPGWVGIEAAGLPRGSGPDLYEEEIYESDHLDFDEP